MYCLDTYALVEIMEGNPKFAFLLEEDFVIPNTTLAEFYWTLLKERGKETADYWYGRLGSFCIDVSVIILIKAQSFRYLNRKKDVSFFDCVGYIFAKEHKYLFVTGDKEFKKLKGVKHITK